MKDLWDHFFFNYSFLEDKAVKRKILFIFLFLFFSFVESESFLFAQMPLATGPGSKILYIIYSNSIYNYDPNQPVSSVNPILNTITLPSNPAGLAVSDNLNASSPSPTFYAISVLSISYPWRFHYYDGTNWINTGYYCSCAAALGAGGGFIFDRCGSSIEKFKGNGNSNVVLSNINSANNDVAADCAGNFYILNGNPPQWLQKYDTTGSLLDSFNIVNGPASSLTYNRGLAIVGNKIYSKFNQGLWQGILIGHSIYYSLITSGGIFTGTGVTDISSYAGSAFSNVKASADTLYYCSGGPADTVYATGLGSFTWSVLSGPATITGSGDTVSITTTANSTILLSSNANFPCGGSGTDTVHIIYVPIPALSLSSNSPLCKGDSLQLSAGSTSSGLSWLWTGPNNFTDSNQHSGRANMTLADSGYYSITATIHGCSGKDSLLVNVKPLPATPVAGSNSPICATDTLLLNAIDSSTGVSWQWTGPNGFSDTLQNPVRSNAPLIDSGKYIVKAILNGCISKPDTIDVGIDPLITPTVSISSLPAIIPAGHTDTFTANATNCPNPVYQWFRNNVLIPGATGNPYIDTLGAGQHISVVVHCGPCASPDSAVSNSLTTTGIPPGPQKWEFAVWPNPVGESLTLSLSEGEGTARVYNAIEQLVYSNKVYRETIIDTRNFAKGVYFVEVIYADGEKVVRKIIKE